METKTIPLPTHPAVVPTELGIPVSTQRDAAPAPMHARSAQPALAVRLVDLIDLLYEGKEVFFRFVREVGDVMSVGVHTLETHATIGDGVAMLKAHGIRHIIVVDRGRMIAIVSQRDIARALPRGTRDETVLRRGIRTIATHEPRSVLSTMPLFAAIEMMIEYKIDCLPVTEGPGRFLLGVLTTTDILKLFLRMETLKRMRKTKGKAARLVDFVGANQQPSELVAETLIGRASDVMQEAVVTVTPDAAIGEALQLMQHHRFRHLPVLDADGTLTGIVSDRDLLSFLPPILEETRNRKDGLFSVDPNDRLTRAALAEKIKVVMTANPVCVELTTPLVKVVECFLLCRMGAVVVVDDKRVIGIVTQTDVLRAMVALGRLLQSASGSAR